MERIRAKSPFAEKALQLVEQLQTRFVNQLSQIVNPEQPDSQFRPVEWYREEGRFGGGVRFVANNDELFDRGSVNVSQVQYEDVPDKKLGSASAISTIIHPKNPLAPSVHIHISWTEMKGGNGYWRVMADLNPSNPCEEDTEAFRKRLEAAAPKQYAEAASQGDRYFFIPALNRHRGVTHFYLENYSTGNFEEDYALAKSVGEAAIDGYCELFRKYTLKETPATVEQSRAQIDYHTLYLFQVLTLDRGTTSGLLVHDQNDVGVLGSLPSHVNKPLLASWVDKMEKPQDQLLKGIINGLPNQENCLVGDDVKQKLAQVVRHHYQSHPEAITMQASGNTTPPTVDNHR